jgi:hypothetical protein
MMWTPSPGPVSSLGYQNFLAAIADSCHEEHADMKRWIGRPFDPAAFDIAEVNERLAEPKP